MDKHVTEVDRLPKFSSEPKAYYSICCELVKASEKIIRILPAIESAQPGSSSGIQVLCSLNNTVEKTKLLIRYCSESSKLYLAITAVSIISRCLRIQSQLKHGLCQIQTMVPLLLASQIAEVLVYLRNVKFIINPGEEEAGKVLSKLLAQITNENQEFEAFQIAASRLNIRSSIEILVERRAITKLLDKFHGIDDKKERILKYFLYLIKKYGKQLRSCSGGHKGNSNARDNCFNERMNSESDAYIIGKNAQLPFCNFEVRSELFNGDIPPEEFCCPISSNLMFDPVFISSGQTYERICIEKWFSEGHDTCPKTQKKLENLSLVTNSYMKDLVSSWCRKHGVILVDPCIHPEETDLESCESIHCNSLSSLKNISTELLHGPKDDCLIKSVSNISSLYSGSSCCSDLSRAVDIECSNNNHIQLFTWSIDYQKYQSFSNFNQDMYLKFLFELSELPTLLQVKAVEYIKNLLEGDEVTYCVMVSTGFTEALMKFLKKAHSLSDLEAQRSGAQIFLALVTNKRCELTFEIEDVIKLLSSFLNCGIEKEAMMILQKLLLHPNYISCIITSDIPLEVVNFINSEDTESLEIAVNILSELSSHGEMNQFLSSGCLEKIGQLLLKRNLVRLCLNILQSFADDEEASMLITDSNGCIASIVQVLEFGNPEEQEQAVTILLSLCSRNLGNCLSVLKEEVIPSIVHISVTGNAKGKENCMKLLEVLKSIRHNKCIDNPQPLSEVESLNFDSPQPHSEVESVFVQLPAKNSKKMISDRMRFGFISRKMRRISKFLALF